jgi:hypothetical protein
MKNAVFWDVTQCGHCKNRRFGATHRLHHWGEENQQGRNNVSSNQQLRRRFISLISLSPKETSPNLESQQLPREITRV